MQKGSKRRSQLVPLVKTATVTFWTNDNRVLRKRLKRQLRTARGRQSKTNTGPLHEALSGGLMICDYSGVSLTVVEDILREMTGGQGELQQCENSILNFIYTQGRSQGF